MIVLFGKRYYGVVDRVPGLLYVITLFVHIYYVPVAPYQSYLIKAGGKGNRAIPLQSKSVLAGYLRGLSSAACMLLTLTGVTLAGVCGVLAVTCLILGPSATDPVGGTAQQPLDVAWVGGIALGVALGIAILCARAYVLTERPKPGNDHPAAVRLLWHMALTGFVIALGVGQLLAALAVYGIAHGRIGALLTFLPIAVCGVLAAAELLSYAYRLTLFLTPATYERALELAAEYGVPEQMVDAQYGK